jgi:hypothetical protein
MNQYTSPDLPEFSEGEIEIVRGAAQNRKILIIGVIMTFIPPFLWGPLVIWMYFHQKKNHVLILTSRRVIDTKRGLKGTYRVTEIPINDIIGSSINFNPIDRFIGGAGDLFIRYDDEGASRRLSFENLRNAHAFQKILLSHVSKNP